MLTEFLLTPDALSDFGGQDGAEVLRDLGNCLFPFAAAPTALVCKLGGEEWTQALTRRIINIHDVNQRQLAMTLMGRLMDQLAVTRPAIARQNDGEAEWVQAGLMSSAQLPLGRLVVSRKVPPPATLGTSVNEFVSAAFWEKLPNPRLVGRDVKSQESVLRALCAHSEWMILRLPQIRGGGDDEIVTVKQIIELASGLPAGFQNTEFDLHVAAQPNIPDDRLVRNIRAELEKYVRKGAAINVAIWPVKHFINRELVAGQYAETSAGKRIRRPLWLITMTHVAVGGGNAAAAGEAGNTWSLFSRKDANDRFQRIGSEVPTKVTAL